MSLHQQITNLRRRLRLRTRLKRIFSAPYEMLSTTLLGTLTHVNTTDPAIALTFDDGPDPLFTPRLLDLLDRYNARATFFMIGENAAHHREIVVRAASTGHAIGNHTWDHPAMPLVSSHERIAQIIRCQEALAPFGQKLFRPPYGCQSLASRIDAARLGYQVVTWNLPPFDWLDRSAAEIAGFMLPRLKPGAIVLLHDRLHYVEQRHFIDRTPTITAVEQVLEQLASTYRFVTIPELLRLGQPRYENWYDKADAVYLNTLYSPGGHGRQYTIS